jgi:DNA anti-recombination protein RmuC
MPSLKTIGALLLSGLLGLLAVFSARAKQAQAERDQARQQADIASAANDYHERADQAMAELLNKQREETINAQRDLENQRRDQLDTDY